MGSVVVRGRPSDVVSDAGVKQMQALIPQAQVQSADAGHMIASHDNGVFASHVLQFLNSIDWYSRVGAIRSHLTLMKEQVCTMSIHTQHGTLQGKRALVVGGTSGIGLAAAVGLARAGAAQITLVGRNENRGAAAQRIVSAEGAEVKFLSGDAGRVDEAARIVANAIDAMGELDIVVNSVAPIATTAPIELHPAQEMLDLMLALAAPPLLITREAIVAMRQSGGSIINVASDAAKVPTPGEAAVGAGMAAIAMFSRTAALEAKRYGVRINVLTPSLVLETGTAERIAQESFASKLFDQVIKKAALGVPTADEVAELIVFLSGPGASKITGQIVSVNGGISAG